VATSDTDHTPLPGGEALENSNALGADALLDGLALDLVTRTYDRYQMYRYNNHDKRWNGDDALYYGYIPQRFWEGTTIPRASLGIPVVFDQIESALPAITNAIFQGSTEWFQVEPLPGTTLQEAQDVQAHLLYLLEQPQDKFGSTARTEITQAIKSVLLYGNGAIMLEIDPETSEPVIHWVDNRDLYVDPGCGSQSEEAKAMVLVKHLTVEQLDALRDTPGFKLPSLDVLKQYSNERPFDAGDRTKQISEITRGVRFRPGWDDRADLPSDRSVEVRIYYSKTRIIWVLNRQWVAYNQGNPYGFYPICTSPCFIIPGRYYAMGYADVLDGIQKFMQGITNSRLDELALASNPPRTRKRGPILTPSQSRWRPGLIMEFDNPQTDMVIHPVQQVTQASWQEMAFLEQQAEKRTGVNSLVTQGTPLRSNASRTTAGINAQMEAPTSRIQKIVETIEDS